MNKFFLLIFVFFCALIFYQGILSNNGILEKFSIDQEKEKLTLIINLLQNEVRDNDKYIDNLKKDPHALEALANELGFFQEDAKLLRIIEDFKMKDISAGSITEKDKELLIKKIKENNDYDIKLDKIRMWIKTIFYIVFGFFIILIIFSVRKNEE